jgi:hypothetical protein
MLSVIEVLERIRDLMFAQFLIYNFYKEAALSKHKCIKDGKLFSYKIFIDVSLNTSFDID